MKKIEFILVILKYVVQVCAISLSRRCRISQGIQRRNDGSFQSTFVMKVAWLPRSPSTWSSSAFQSLSFLLYLVDVKLLIMTNGKHCHHIFPIHHPFDFSCKTSWSCCRVLVSFCLVEGVSSSSSSRVPNIKVTMLFHDLAVPMLLFLNHVSMQREE